MTWIDDLKGQIPSLPEGGIEDQVLAKASDQSGDTEWADPSSIVPKDRFQGAWTPVVYDSLALYDFADGELGPLVPAGNVSVVAYANVGGGVSPTPAKMVRIDVGTLAQEGQSRVTLSISDLVAEFPSVAAVRFWFTGTGIQDRVWFARDGVEQFEVMGDPWTQYTVPVEDNSILMWRQGIVSFAEPYANGLLARLEILEISGAGYGEGSLVTHKGTLYQSAIDQNGFEPGTDPSWVEVPLNSGVVYTSANRPDAAEAGKGTQIYDEDLDLPLWSNGTTWKDAAGTVR